VKTRKTKTTIEIHQVYVIRQGEGLASVLCSECLCGKASMVTPEDAALVAEIPVRQIYRLVEAGLIHYLEGEDNSLLVCLNSLPTTGTGSKFDGITERILHPPDRRSGT
jgi:hypothetical protein